MMQSDHHCLCKLQGRRVFPSRILLYEYTISILHTLFMGQLDVSIQVQDVSKCIQISLDYISKYKDG